MISLSNTSAQTLAPGQTLTFNNVIFKSRCGSESWRNGTGLVKMRSDCGIYEIVFNANVTGATAGAAVQVGMSLSGAALPETTAVYTPAAANAIGHISTSTIVKNSCGDYDSVSIVNNGTNPVIISANANIFVRRIA